MSDEQRKKLAAAQRALVAALLREGPGEAPSAQRERLRAHHANNLSARDAMCTAGHP